MNIMKIFFTDLDGTLLDGHYSYEKAEEALELLREKNIPLIICTSKTRAEIELYRKRLDNKDPFISENGGAIFIPKNYFDFGFEYDKELGEYFVIELGKPYKELRKVLEEIKNTGLEIRGFGDMGVDEIADETGLPKEEAGLAKRREYDEVFKLINGDENRLIGLIKEKGLDYAKGGNYYHILLGNKGDAVKKLSGLFRKKYGKLTTIGIGDAENDFEMLDSVDAAYLVMKGGGDYASEKYNKADGIGPEGWNLVVINELKEGKND